jgi:medium-chain acyl-[acyl-carrier-protein] hydrolase
MTRNAAPHPDGTTGKWFVRLKGSADGATRLFCFPFAGVGPSAFRGWGSALGDEIEVFVAQLPGRESRFREEPLDSICTLVRRLEPAVIPLIDRPYALFGHSLGGLIAFELARSLAVRGGAQPRALFVSASRAPQLPYPHAPLRHLGDKEFLQAVNARYAGSVPRLVMDDPELRRVFVPALRADIAALETYVHQRSVPLSCDISAFGGTADETIEPRTLAAWRDLTTGAFQLRMVAGTHLFLQSARDLLSSAVRNDLGCPSVAEAR